MMGDTETRLHCHNIKLMGYTMPGSQTSDFLVNFSQANIQERQIKMSNFLVQEDAALLNV